MRFNIFEINGNELTLNKPEILLVKEFEALMDLDRNMCKEDKTGKKRLRAFKEFRYIWLSQDFRSDYMELTEDERVSTALDDCGMKPVDLTDKELRGAIRKYNELQESRIMKLLISAHGMVDKLRQFFTTVDLEEKDDHGKLVHSAKDVIANLSNLGKVVDGLQVLEYQVKKDMEATKGIRGDAQPGLYDNPS
jgi:hypothetical protein